MCVYLVKLVLETTRAGRDFVHLLLHRTEVVVHFLTVSFQRLIHGTEPLVHLLPGNFQRLVHRRELLLHFLLVAFQRVVHRRDFLVRFGHRFFHLLR